MSSNNIKKCDDDKSSEWFTFVNCLLNHIDNDYIKDLVVLSTKTVYTHLREGEGGGLGREEAARRWIFHNLCRTGGVVFYRVVEHEALCYRRIVRTEVGVCDDRKRVLLWDSLVDSIDFDSLEEFWQYLEECDHSFLMPSEYEGSIG